MGRQSWEIVDITERLSEAMASIWRLIKEIEENDRNNKVCEKADTGCGKEECCKHVCDKESTEPRPSEPQ